VPANPDEPLLHLFNPKSGVLREREYDAALWEDLFAPFGPSITGNLTADFSDRVARTLREQEAAEAKTATLEATVGGASA